MSTYPFPDDNAESNQSEMEAEEDQTETTANELNFEFDLEDLLKKERV